MSTSNGDLPLDATQSQIQCPGCQSPITVTNPPNLATNELQISAIMVPHLEPVLCSCGKLFMPQIQSWQIVMRWVEVKAESLPGVIVRPQGRLVM